MDASRRTSRALSDDPGAMLAADKTRR